MPEETKVRNMRKRNAFDDELDDLDIDDLY